MGPTAEMWPFFDHLTLMAIFLKAKSLPLNLDILNKFPVQAQHVENSKLRLVSMIETKLLFKLLIADEGFKKLLSSASEVITSGDSILYWVRIMYLFLAFSGCHEK